MSLTTTTPRTVLAAPAEVTSYPVDRLDFTIVAVGGSLIILLLIKHWRDHYD